MPRLPPTTFTLSSKIVHGLDGERSCVDDGATSRAPTPGIPTGVTVPRIGRGAVPIGVAKLRLGGVVANVIGVPCADVGMAVGVDLSIAVVAGAATALAVTLGAGVVVGTGSEGVGVGS